MTTQTAYVQTGESESDCFSGGSFSIPSDGIDTAAVPSCHSYPHTSTQESTHTQVHSTHRYTRCLPTHRYIAVHPHRYCLLIGQLSTHTQLLASTVIGQLSTNAQALVSQGSPKYMFSSVSLPSTGTSLPSTLRS